MASFPVFSSQAGHVASGIHHGQTSYKPCLYRTLSSEGVRRHTNKVTRGPVGNAVTACWLPLSVHIAGDDGSRGLKGV